MKSVNNNRRRGYTVIEVSIALTSAGILAIGLSSALFISFQAAGSEATPAPALLRGSEFLTDLQLDLQDASSISEQQSRSITVTVPDRTGDSIDDTIRYSWTPSPGNPTFRQFNGGTSENILDDVHQFDIRYETDSGDVEALTIEIQVGLQSEAILQTSFPLSNRP